MIIITSEAWQPFIYLAIRLSLSPRGVILTPAMLARGKQILYNFSLFHPRKFFLSCVSIQIQSPPPPLPPLSPIYTIFWKNLLQKYPAPPFRLSPTRAEPIVQGSNRTTDGNRGRRKGNNNTQNRIEKKKKHFFTPKTYRNRKIRVKGGKIVFL